MNTTQIAGAGLALLLLGMLTAPLGCYRTTGYRDQVRHDLAAAARGQPAYGGLVDEAARRNEFLAAYSFENTARDHDGLAVDAYLGAMRDDSGMGWLMLSVAAPPIPAEELPPKRWVLALDAGRSMRGDRWTLSVDAASRLVEALGDTDKVRLVEVAGPQTRTTNWMEKRKAVAALAKRRLSPATGFAADGPPRADSLRAALHPYDSPRSANASPSAVWDSALFYFTDGVGLETMRWDFLAGAEFLDAGRKTARELRADGAKIHIVGIAGGDGPALRRLARESGGGYVFLADSADMERVLSADAVESFSTAYSDLTYSVDGLAHDWQAGERDYPGCNQPRRRKPSPRANGGALGSLAPGETVLRLFRVEVARWSGRSVRIAVKGKDRFGREFSKKRDVVPHVCDLARPAGPAARNMRKALAIKQQVDYLNHVAAAASKPPPADTLDVGELWAKRRAELSALHASLRETAALLNDGELKRDTQSIGALARLSEKDIEKLGRETLPPLPPGQQAKRAAFAPPRFALGGVAVGGVVVVAVPLVILGCLLGGCA